MAPCSIELTIIAAEGLKNVSLLRGKMNPFALAFVDPFSKLSTRSLRKGGSDPVWNDTLRIPVEDRLLCDPNSSLTIQVLNQSSVSTSLVGATRLMLQDLFRHKAFKGSDEGDVLMLQLFRPSGRPHGLLRVFLKVVGEGGFSNNGMSSEAAAPTTATGIPLMSMHQYPAGPPAFVVPCSPEKSGKDSYPDPAYYTQAGYLPYPTPPSQYWPRRSNNKNLLVGLVGGALAAILLGAIF